MMLTQQPGRSFGYSRTAINELDSPIGYLLQYVLEQREMCAAQDDDVAPLFDGELDDRSDLRLGNRSIKVTCFNQFDPVRGRQAVDLNPDSVLADQTIEPLTGNGLGSGDNADSTSARKRNGRFHRWFESYYWNRECFPQSLNAYSTSRIAGQNEKLDTPAD
jgi:hypothetical protein